jgi:ribosomal protein S12 methylthiotransferase accessory factor
MESESASALAKARRAAELSGVTRLADVTGLDRLGIPVFQAIRPWSRALSVHQGKGLEPTAAQIGALMEAVESEHAESFSASGPICAYAELPREERAPRLADFSQSRRLTPGDRTPIRWVEATTLLDERTLWTPFDVVSLDLTRDAPSPFERSSAGLAAHFTREDAARAALLEVIERDAVARWMKLGLLARTWSRIDSETIPFGWFQRLRGRLSVNGVRPSIYRAEAVISTPVFVCELIEAEAVAVGRGAVYGTACRPDAEGALLQAMLEAIQSRLTEIVGARDDIGLPPAEKVEPAPFGLGLPPPTNFEPRSWNEPTSERPFTAAPSARDLARRLARAGYGQAAIVDLSRRGSGVSVVKAVVPGLAGARRSRRDPAVLMC